MRRMSDTSRLSDQRPTISRAQGNAMGKELVGPEACGLRDERRTETHERSGDPGSRHDGTKAASTLLAQLFGPKIAAGFIPIPRRGP